jgi:hydrogenase maturation protein HypF
MLAGDNSYLRQYKDILQRLEPDQTRLALIAQQLEKNINTVSTSSLGRLFDAAACLAGLGNYNHFEAQLPMALESAADESVKDRYTSVIKADSNGTLLLDVRNMLIELIEDLRMGASAALVSAKFHNCLAHAMLDFALQARQKHQLSTVALSGGVFCNRYLANLVITMLKKNDFSVLFKQRIPANDGGIALGQAAIAAKAVQSG